MSSLETKKLSNLDKNRLSKLEIYKSLCLQIRLIEDNRPHSWDYCLHERWQNLRQQIKEHAIRPLQMPDISSEDDQAYTWIGVNQIVPDRCLLDYEKNHLRQLVQQIITIPSFPDNINNYFAPNNQQKRIKLRQINLATGPAYVIISGHDRVGGCYLAGLQQIPCELVR